MVPKKCGCAIESDGDLGIKRFMNSSMDWDSVDPAGFTGEYYHTLRKKYQFFSNPFRKLKRALSNSLYEANIALIQKQQQQQRHNEKTIDQHPSQTQIFSAIISIQHHSRGSIQFCMARKRNKWHADVKERN